MSQSPEGWVETPLDTVVSSSVGGMWGSPTPNGGDVPVRVIRGAEFRDWSTTRAASAPRRFIPAAALASRQLKLGDIVLEVSGGGPTQPVGRTVLIDEEALKSAEDALICSNFCRRIVLSRELNPWFVWYQLLHGYSRGNTDAFQRATTNIRNLQVPRYLAGTYLVVPRSPNRRGSWALLTSCCIRSTLAFRHCRRCGETSYACERPYFSRR